VAADDNSRRVTIDDVARLAGVSRQTVSRAINDKPEIDPATRDRILALAQQLGYRPSRFARAMVKQDVVTLALIISDVLNPFFPEVAAGVLDAADERDWQVIVYTTNSLADKERKVARTVTTQADACVGFLVDHEAISILSTSGVPLILLDSEGVESAAPGVRIDFEKGVEQGIAHLSERGHTRIAMIAARFDDRPDAVHRPVDARRDRYLSITARLGLPIDESWILRADNSIEGGATALGQLLAEHPDATAVLAYNDLIAIGAMRRALALGLSVPGDLAVVGFDGLTLGELVDPQLTTLAIDKRRLGRLAVEQVATLLPGAAPNASGTEPIVVPTLVQREST
jgi:LacI family transcriptional regulator